MLLPHEFWVPHGEPAWKGGVERALMSTTADKAVALHYANGRGTVVEIDVGRIQIGGDVSILSMVRTTSPALLPLPLHGQHHPAPLALGVSAGMCPAKGPLLQLPLVLLQGCALQKRLAKKILAVLAGRIPSWQPWQAVHLL
jgi:hypothetical protein